MSGVEAAELEHDVDWCMQAERFVEANLKHILSDPNLAVPEGADPVTWLHDKAAALAVADDKIIETMVLRREPFWQFAKLHQMTRQSLIKNFGFRLDSISARLYIFIEPLSPSRIIALNVPGIPVTKDLTVQ
jgi:hypothetical protein